MQNKRTIIGLLVLGTAFWGISFPVTKLAIGNNSPAVFLCYRFLVATVILAIIFRRKIKIMSPSMMATGITMAIPLMLGIYLQTQGLKHSGASQCAFIAGTSVILVPVLKWLLYRKAAATRIWIAAMVALAGLFIISMNGQFIPGIGDLYTFSGAFAFAYYLIWVERRAAKGDMLPAVVPMFATCTIITCILALIEGNAVWLPADSHFWTGVVFCGFFSTAFMYTVSNISQRYISAEKVAIIYLFEPVFGAVAAWFILDENFTARLLIGGALIFAATLVAEVKFRKVEVA